MRCDLRQAAAEKSGEQQGGKAELIRPRAASFHSADHLEGTSQVYTAFLPAEAPQALLKALTSSTLGHFLSMNFLTVLNTM